MKRKIITGGVYHVLNRGVDKRKIFLDDQDYFRFIHDLFEFNDEQPINNGTYYFQNQSKVIARPYIGDKERRPRKLLVEILVFSLMPNHYHLLLRPKIEDGITKFMKRLNMGYARYFNEKYKRSGALFEGRYKSVAVIDEAHFIHLPYYIHFNPLDLIAPEWRERNLKNYKKVITFLESYRWSSHLDYIGKKNFPSVTQREFLLEFFGGNKEYESKINNWLEELDLSNFGDFLLE
ncbi:MAG: transposase [Candidatus Harrisonbacteria bacterium]|nr:transposase [Candidatus Harrisonbacteria bacterium]